MRITIWVLQMFFFLHYKRLVDAQEKIYERIINRHFIGIHITTKTEARSVTKCAFLCDSLQCVGFNTEPNTNAAAANNAHQILCTPFSNLTGLANSTEAQMITGWTDTCKVELCGAEDIPCFTTLDIVDINACTCRDGYVKTSTGCQDSCKYSGGEAVVGGQCLVFYKEKITWNGAKEACEAEGWHLASVMDPQALLDYITKNPRTDRFWVGGTDAATEGTWLWLDGRAIEAEQQLPWYGDEPNNHGGGQDCLCVKGTNGEYVDYSCSFEQPYICSIDI